MNIGSIKINDFLYYVGVNDRLTPRFENIWPLENGVSYNSYFIVGEKNIVLDLVKSTKYDNFMENVRNTSNRDNIDYLIINHMEPDHSSSLKLFLKNYPNIKVIGNKKTNNFIKEMYKIDLKDNFIEVKDGEELTLGDKTFTFFMTPMVHWPESMMTYEHSKHILFSQDAFGGYNTLNGGIFDDEINWDFHEYETRRYYSNIVGKFSSQVQKALKKLKDLKIQMICPVHGVVWRKNPEIIINAYNDYSSYKTEPGCIIAYGSMYGNTERMADFLGRALSEQGVKNIKIFDVSKTHPSHILADIWKYNGLLLGSCTYNNGLYEPMQTLVNILKSNKIQNHILGIFGCYGWSGGGVSTLKKFGESGKYDFIENEVEAKFAPDKDDYEKLSELAKTMAEKINN